jgi:hypothetical protein
MKKLIRTIGALSFLAACDSTGDSGYSIGGTWVFEYEDYECSETLQLKGNRYTHQLICILDDDNVGNEVETGTFSTKNGEITFQPERSSCPDDDGKKRVYDYVVFKNELELVGDRGFIRFLKLDAKGTGQGSALFGCYDDDGEFVESPVRDL